MEEKQRQHEEMERVREELYLEEQAEAERQKEIVRISFCSTKMQRHAIIKDMILLT